MSLWTLLRRALPLADSSAIEEEQLPALAQAEAQVLDRFYEILRKMKVLEPPGIFHGYDERMNVLRNSLGNCGDYIGDLRIYSGGYPGMYYFPPNLLYIAVEMFSLFDDEELLFLAARQAGHAMYGRQVVEQWIMEGLSRIGIDINGNLNSLTEALQGHKLISALTERRPTLEQEIDADAFGVKFMLQNGRDLGAPITALRKLFQTTADPAYEKRLAVVCKLILPDTLGCKK